MLAQQLGDKGWISGRTLLAPLSSILFPFTLSPASEPKAAEEMKGTDQEYSSALAQYNSSANSGGEDIELLAFQTVTGRRAHVAVTETTRSLQPV